MISWILKISTFEHCLILEYFIKASLSFSPAAIPFLNLMIDSLSMSLSIKRGTPPTVCLRSIIPMPQTNYSSPKLTSKGVKKCLMITFPSSFFIFIADCQHSIIIPYVLVTKISWLIFTTLFAILNTSSFWSFIRIATPICFLTASRLAL